MRSDEIFDVVEESGRDVYVEQLIDSTTRHKLRVAHDQRQAAEVVAGGEREFALAVAAVRAHCVHVYLLPRCGGEIAGHMVIHSVYRAIAQIH